MEIRKADSKGRVTVGIDGEIYQVVRHEDGTMTLSPVKIPEPPQMENTALRALYWDPAARSTQPDRVYIHSVLTGGIQQSADFLAGIANTLKIPIVVKVGGAATAAADYLAEGNRVEREVIQVR